MVPTFLLDKQLLDSSGSSTPAVPAEPVVGPTEELPHCGRRAFIRYLDKKAGLEDIKNSLSRYGQLLEIQLALKKDKTANLGMCSVTFAESSSVDTLLLESGSLTIKGKKVKVERFRITNLSCTSVKWTSKSSHTNEGKPLPDSFECSHKEHPDISCCVSLPGGAKVASGIHVDVSCKISCSRSGNLKSSRIVTEYLVDSREHPEDTPEYHNSGHASSRRADRHHQVQTELGDCNSSCHSSQDHHNQSVIHHHHHDPMENDSTCLYARHVCSAEVRRGERSCSSAHQITCSGAHDLSPDKNLRSDLFKKHSKYSNRDDLGLKSGAKRRPGGNMSPHPTTGKQGFIIMTNQQDAPRIRLCSVDVMNKSGLENTVELLGMMNGKRVVFTEVEKAKGSISSPKPTNKDYYSNPRHHLVKINKNHHEANLRFNRV